MSAGKIVLSLALLSLPITGYGITCNGMWDGAGSSGMNEWGNNNNWTPSCFPGTPGNVNDTATFTGSTPTTIYLLTPGSPVPSPYSPVMQTVTFNTSGTPETYIINPDSLSSPTATLGFYTSTGCGSGCGIEVDTSGLTQTIQAPIVFTSPGTAPWTVTVDAGTLVINGNISDPGMGSTLYVNGAGTFIYTNTNGNNLSPTATFGGSGTFMDSNVGAIDIVDGFFQITNSIALTSVDGPSLTLNNAEGDIFINGGELDLINSGPITSTLGNSGVSLNMGGSNIGSLYLQAGTLTVTNSSDVSMGGSGVFLNLPGSTGNNLTVSSGTTMTMLNENCTISGASSYGVIIYANQLSINGGTSTFQNTDGIVNTGCYGFYFNPLNMTIAGGTVTINNTGTMNTSIISTGAFGAQLATGAFIMSSGTLTISNSSLINTINSGAFGAQLTSSTISQTGGVIEVQMTTTSQSGIGANLDATTSIDVSGGILSNDELVTTPIFNIDSGGSVCGIGLFQSENDMATAFTNSGTLYIGDFPNLNDLDPTTIVPGTMNLQGTYAQTSSPTGVLSITILDTTMGDNPGPTTFPLLQMTGISTLGGTLQVVPSSGGTTIASGNTITILTSDGLNLTTFDTVTPTISGYTINTIYNPQSVQLQFLSPSPPPSPPPPSPPPPPPPPPSPPPSPRRRLLLHLLHRRRLKQLWVSLHIHLWLRQFLHRLTIPIRG